MLEKIISTAIGVIVTAIVTGIIGYLTGKMKGYKRRDTRQEEALKCLLRSNITSKYYVYSELKEIPYYEKENIDRMFEQYKNMGGNSYVDTIVREINSLPMKK
jgi:AAA15 family ATPase/GTPase